MAKGDRFVNTIEIKWGPYDNLSSRHIACSGYQEYELKNILRKYFNIEYKYSIHTRYKSVEVPDKPQAWWMSSTPRQYMHQLLVESPLDYIMLDIYTIKGEYIKTGGFFQRSVAAPSIFDLYAYYAKHKDVINYDNIVVEETELKGLTLFLKKK